MRASVGSAAYTFSASGAVSPTSFSRIQVSSTTSHRPSAAAQPAISSSSRGSRSTSHWSTRPARSSWRSASSARPSERASAHSARNR